MLRTENSHISSQNIYNYSALAVLHLASITLVVLGSLQLLQSANIPCMLAGSIVALGTAYMIINLYRQKNVTVNPEITDDVIDNSSSSSLGTTFPSTSSVESASSIFEPMKADPNFFNILRSPLFLNASVAQTGLYDPMEKTDLWLNQMHIYRYFEYIDLHFPIIIPNDQKLITFDNFSLSFFEPFNKEQSSRHLELPIATYVQVGGNHWALVFIDPKTRTIEYYDSKVNYAQESVDRGLKKLAAQLTTEHPGTPYTYSKKITKLLQPDSNQCGIWICYFLEKRLQHPHINFNEIDLDYAQRMMANFRIHVREQVNQMHNVLGKELSITSNRYIKKYSSMAEFQARQLMAKDIESTYGPYWNPHTGYIARHFNRKRLLDVLKGNLLTPKD